MSLSVLFCGSPTFAALNLQALINLSCITNLTVISQPDKIRARGKKVMPTEVKQLANQHKLNVFCPTTKEEFSTITTTINPDIVIVVAYAMIIPKIITDTFLCVNSHASLLPKYRGASPIQTAILNREPKTGICLIHMNDKLDEGQIIMQDEIPLLPDDTYDQIHNSLANLSVKLLSNFLNNFNKTKIIQSLPQNHDLATYCTKITKEDLLINLDHSIERKMAQIKAYSAKPGAYILQNNKRIKIIDAEIINNELIPTKIQLEGKPVISYSDYLLGRKEAIKLC